MIPGSPTFRQAIAQVSDGHAGREMLELAARLYPICRSITGQGVRDTLGVLAERLPLNVVEIPTGTPVFDWEVPREWNAREAWIKTSDGRTVIDFRNHNLHLLNYSAPIHTHVDRVELEAHLYSLPDQPDLIPYRTSYYEERWGFCLPHSLRETLQDDTYEVFIDTTLSDGHLTYGELLLPGESERETLISCHICHPSLANDNLSGIVVTTFLAEILARLDHQRSYRFLFIPGTIGSITWLSQNAEGARNIDAGLVAANLGDEGGLHYKRTWQGDSRIDEVVPAALADLSQSVVVEDFVPYGYDERQYASPAFRLPVGSLTRTPHGRYPEYHTSADDLTLLREEALAGSLIAYLNVARFLEAANDRPVSRNPHCEPQLGKRGLYGTTGGSDSGRDRQLALLWVLNLADGDHDLLTMARRSGLGLAAIEEAAERLRAADLLSSPP